MQIESPGRAVLRYARSVLAMAVALLPARDARRPVGWASMVHARAGGWTLTESHLVPANRADEGVATVSSPRR